ncbi:MAG: hypothetical protein R2712_22190 [Vicinamibacterales bacterium]
MPGSTWPRGTASWRSPSAGRPLSPEINLRTINQGPESFQLCLRPGPLSAATRGCARDRLGIANRNATYSARRAAMANWEHRTNLVSDGITYNMKMRDLLCGWWSRR